MSRRHASIAALVAAALAIAAYWWWSPQIVLHRMQSAAARGDTDALLAHVDAPALRDSLKGQFSTAMAGKIGAPGDNPLSALGSALGMAFVDPLVSVMVRPQTIASALQTGRVRPGASASAQPDGAIVWELERQGADRAVFRAHRDGEVAGPEANAFVFVRHGFADWKLAEIRLQLPS